MRGWLFPSIGTASLVALSATLALMTFEFGAGPAPAEDKTLKALSEPEHVNDVVFGQAPQSRDHYAQIIQRPLFDPLRRPNTLDVDTKLSQSKLEPVKEKPKKTVQPPELTLLGVMKGNVGNAVLLSVDGADAEWFGNKAEVTGWDVIAIGSDWVELAKEEQTIRVEMYQK